MKIIQIMFSKEKEEIIKVELRLAATLPEFNAFFIKLQTLLFSKGIQSQFLNLSNQEANYFHTTFYTNNNFLIDIDIYNFCQAEIYNPDLQVVLRPQDISLTVFPVPQRFEDGTSVDDTVLNLQSGEITPSQLPKLRVTYSKKRWITPDDSLLYVFKRTFVQNIQVILTDPRSVSLQSKPAHSESKVEDKPKPLLFTHHVLRWNVEQLKDPLPGLPEKPLQDHFEPATYYSNFLSLILEETRAHLQSAITTQCARKAKPLSLRLENFERSKDTKKHSTIILSGEPGEKILVKASDVFILQLPAEKKEIPPLRMLAFGCAVDHQEYNHVRFKVEVSHETLQKFSSSFFEKKAHWEAIPLESVATQLRMYEVCLEEPKIPWLQELCAGVVAPLSSHKFSEEENVSLAHLNKSQKKVIHGLLTSKRGLQLVLGPPGTGKTTTAVALLAELVKRNQRILVCAPSNKAIQVLVERFISQSPNVAVLLAGVDDKLPEDNQKLHSVFMPSWGPRKLKEINELREQLKALDFSQFHSQNRVIPLADISKSILTLSEKFKLFEDDLVKFGFEFVTYAFKKTVNNCNCGTTSHPSPNIFNMLAELVAIGNQLFNHIEKKLNELMPEDANNRLEGLLLSRARIIFCTNSVSARKVIKESIGAIDVVVIDEAVQSIEAETLIPLRFCPDRCILFGDPNQLSPTLVSSSAAKRKLGRPLMSRLIEDCRQPYFMLTEQWRMHPEIRSFPSRQFYRNELTDAKKIDDNWRLPALKTAPACFGPYAFIDVHGCEEKVNTSYINRREAEWIKKFVVSLQRDYALDVKNQVKVITFYKSQAHLIRQTLQPIAPDMTVSTVDAFQGEEHDMIIISFVRANPRGKTGFIKDPRRLNVSLTRSKHALIMVGDVPTLTAQKHDVADVVNDAIDRCFLFREENVEPYLRGIQKPDQSSFSNYRASHTQNNLPRLVSPALLPSTNLMAKTGFCRFFNGAPNSCKYGDRCKFVHKTQEPSRYLSGNDDSLELGLERRMSNVSL